MQLKEEKARLIMERQVNEDRGSAFSKVMAELEELKHKHQALEEEAASLRTRVSDDVSQIIAFVKIYFLPYDVLYHMKFSLISKVDFRGKNFIIGYEMVGQE